MAAAWARAKRALATSLCFSVPARQRAIEDAAVEVPSSVAEDKQESASVSVRRLTSFGSRSSQQVGIHLRFFVLSFLPFAPRSFPIHVEEMSALALDFVRILGKNAV